jgi:hypothetical protein
MFLTAVFTATGIDENARFKATGAGGDGAVCLARAHIGGQLDLAGAQLRNDCGRALHAERLQADRDLFLNHKFAATGAGAGVAVDLSGARVGGTFMFDPARLEHKATSHRLLAVDGLTYAGVPEPISAKCWRHLLRHSTPRYAAQPYQQLAAGYRALGDEREARETLIKQRDHQLARSGPDGQPARTDADDQLARTDPGCPERLWGWITKYTLGYGYKPWRALWFLGAVVVISCVLAVVLGSHGALTRTKDAAHPGWPCTVVQQVSVGLDLNLPVGTSVARVQCGLTKHAASVTAAWLTGVGWVLRVLAWTFAALFIAGFTSAVRKT